MIQKKSLAEEVAQHIQDKILAGEYPVDSKLPIEPVMMKTYDVGRSSIREAMKLLSNGGFVRVQQGIGTFVEDTAKRKKDINQQFKQASPKDVEEIRQLFELTIAEKAAANRTQKDIKNITAFLKERNKAALEERLQDCISADINFHIAIAVAAKNEILADLYRSATVHVKNGFSQFRNTSSFIKSQRLHQDLLNSIVQQDTKKARLAANKILLRN